LHCACALHSANFDHYAGDVPSAECGTPHRYRMNHKERGLFIIINNMEFQSGWTKRRASDADADSIRKGFELLGFTVRTYTNLTVNEIIELMRKGTH